MAVIKAVVTTAAFFMVSDSTTQQSIQVQFLITKAILKKWLTNKFRLLTGYRNIFFIIWRFKKGLTPICRIMIRSIYLTAFLFLTSLPNSFHAKVLFPGFVNSTEIKAGVYSGEVQTSVAQPDSLIPTTVQPVEDQNAVTTYSVADSPADTVKVAESDTITDTSADNTDIIPDTDVSINADTLTVAKSGTVATADTLNIANTDTIPEPVIEFTPETASDFLINLMKLDSLFRPEADTMRISLNRLLDHYNESINTVKNRLTTFEYDSVRSDDETIVINDTLPVRWLNDSTFILDTLPLTREPFFTRKTIFLNGIDTTAFAFTRDIPTLKLMMDSILMARDTIVETFIDTSYLESVNLRLHRFTNQSIDPPLFPPGSEKISRFFRDSTKIVTSDYQQVRLANEESPFFVVPNERTTDSLEVAVQTIINYTKTRDSILIYVSGVDGRRMPFWLSSERDEVYRYWVKNMENDSITLWIGNPEKYDITLRLEENVNVERRRKKLADDIPIFVGEPSRGLKKINELAEIPIYWDYLLSSAFTLNQTYLSNWAKGGENSLSSVLDINAGARYNDKASKITWDNTGRVRYGTIITEEHGFISNTDMIELNSQFNKVIKNKIDFSSSFYMKTQIARGYNFPNDSVVVSKFLNPATLTIGAGSEYKPFKRTSLNFSPLSYKNTFVLDTTNIDQTIHGIEQDLRARQEMGGQLVIRSKVSILEDLNISNSVRLFSNYLEKPENIDMACSRSACRSAKSK